MMLYHSIAFIFLYCISTYLPFILIFPCSCLRLSFLSASELFSCPSFPPSFTFHSFFPSFLLLSLLPSSLARGRSKCAPEASFTYVGVIDSGVCPPLSLFFLSPKLHLSVAILLLFESAVPFVPPFAAAAAMGRGSVRHQPRASSPTSWRSAAAALLLLAAFALADASQLDEDLTFDEEAVGVARIRREAEVAPVAPPYQEVPSAKATLTKRQSGWGFWGSSSDDEDDDVGSAIEGSGVEKVIYRVKFQVNLTWRVEYSNKQGTYFRDLATEIRNAFEIILRPVSGDKTLFVSNMKRTPTNYVEVTMDINYEGFGDQSGALERRIREALGTSRLGSIPVNTQFFRFEDHGSAVTSPTACPPGKWRCSSGRCVGRCDGRDDCLDKSDEQDCITSSSSSITGSKGECRRRLGGKKDGRSDEPTEGE